MNHKNEIITINDGKQYEAEELKETRDFCDSRDFRRCIDEETDYAMHEAKDMNKKYEWLFC